MTERAGLLTLMLSMFRDASLVNIRRSGTMLR